MSRYEVRETYLKLNSAQLSILNDPEGRDDHSGPRWEVWDTEKGRIVPFGRYRTPEDAEDRIEKMEGA